MVWFAFVGAGAGFPVDFCAVGLAVMLGYGAIPVGPALRFGLGESLAPGDAVCRTVAAVGLAGGDVQAAHIVMVATVTVTAPIIAEPLRENGTVRQSFLGRTSGIWP